MESADQNLRQLMAAYQAGDFDAFESLYGSFAPALTRYLTSLAGERDLAADLVQETFLRIHRARRSYDPRHPFEPWAFAIARHVYLMDRRARARRARREASTVPDAAPIASGHENNFGKRFVHQLMAGLSQERRDLLGLRFVLGLDFHEIGERLGLRPGTARVRLSRALAELRGQAEGKQ